MKSQVWKLGVIIRKMIVGKIKALLTWNINLNLRWTNLKHKFNSDV